MTVSYIRRTGSAGGCAGVVVRCGGVRTPDEGRHWPEPALPPARHPHDTVTSLYRCTANLIWRSDRFFAKLLSKRKHYLKIKVFGTGINQLELQAKIVFKLTTQSDLRWLHYIFSLKRKYIILVFGFPLNMGITILKEVKFGVEFSLQLDKEPEVFKL